MVVKMVFVVIAAILVVVSSAEGSGNTTIIGTDTFGGLHPLVVGMWTPTTGTTATTTQHIASQEECGGEEEDEPENTQIDMSWCKWSNVWILCVIAGTGRLVLRLCSRKNGVTTNDGNGTIRLPPTNHQHFTKRYVNEMIAAAHKTLEAIMPSARYQRRITNRLNNAAAAANALFYFTVLQFNMLAEGLSSGGPAVPPFPPTKSGEFGGFSAVPNPQVCLDFDVRKWLLVEEMLESGADIITFQECDHFYDFFKPVMASFGYAGHWVAKGDSPCLQFGYFSDGVGIFYKTNVWKEVGTGPITSHFVNAAGNPEGNVYMLLPLERKSDGEQVLVATTHLKAKIGPENEARRTLQASQLMEAIRTKQLDHAGRAVVLAADFNTDAYAAESNGTNIPAECIPMVVSCPILALKSAYPLQTSEDDQGGTYTTWKRRGPYEARHTIDFIFHSGTGLECVATLDAVSAADMDAARLPGFQYPSDHLAIKAWLRFPVKV